MTVCISLVLYGYYFLEKNIFIKIGNTIQFIKIQNNPISMYLCYNYY